MVRVFGCMVGRGMRVMECMAFWCGRKKWRRTARMNMVSSSAGRTPNLTSVITSRSLIRDDGQERSRSDNLLSIMNSVRGLNCLRYQSCHSAASCHFQPVTGLHSGSVCCPPLVIVLPLIQTDADTGDEAEIHIRRHRHKVLRSHNVVSSKII